MGIACPSYNLPEISRFSRLGGIKAFRVSEPPADIVSIVDVPHGTLMIVRRQCWRDVGGFDERYFAYGDEGEIGLRAKAKKWNVGLVWGASVVNPGTWTPGSVVTYLTARNSLLTVLKHGGSVAAIVRTALMVLNTGRLVVCGRIPLSIGRIRLTAIKDFIIGNLGRPPQDVLQVGSEGTGA
jgi:GT2 family glycosyltransferase